ncbi:hypothetical protein SOVF_039060 [Spinacia oleracea]|nr:hypothetical protein SOVF_039060 [Spinacia oleracea]
MHNLTSPVQYQHEEKRREAVVAPCHSCTGSVVLSCTYGPCHFCTTRAVLSVLPRFTRTFI